jgi:Tfp pilus assembly protein PilN
MLFVIRINLLGNQKGKKSRRVGLSLPQVPNVGILLTVLGLVIELAVMWSWHSSAAEAADRAQSRLNLKKVELEELKQRDKTIKELKDETDKLAATKTVFEELFADKTGPVNALTYLAFILQPRKESEEPPEALRALEAAGWRVAWDSNRAWFTGMRENGEEVTLTGQALDHEDVAEVQRRLESSPYFREVKLESQEAKESELLGKQPFVEFKIKAVPVYLIEPVVKPPPAPEEGPPAETDAAAGDADAGSAAPETATPEPVARPIVPVPPAHAPDTSDAADSTEASDAADADASADSADAAISLDTEPPPAQPAPPPSPAPPPRAESPKGEPEKPIAPKAEPPPTSDKAAPPPPVEAPAKPEPPTKEP